MGWAVFLFRVKYLVTKVSPVEEMLPSAGAEEREQGMGILEDCPPPPGPPFAKFFVVTEPPLNE
jgi:hypothetical protein